VTNSQRFEGFDRPRYTPTPDALRAQSSLCSASLALEGFTRSTDAESFSVNAGVCFIKWVTLLTVSLSGVRSRHRPFFIRAVGDLHRFDLRPSSLRLCSSVNLHTGTTLTTAVLVQVGIGLVEQVSSFAVRLKLVVVRFYTHVLSVSHRPEMLGLDTGRVLADMMDVLADRVLTSGHPVRQAMSCHGLPLGSEPSVTKLVPTASPNPASVYLDVNFLPEAFGLPLVNQHIRLVHNSNYSIGVM